MTISSGRGKESGQAAVEMALILSILLFLVMGMLEFSRAWNVKHVVTDATREGARHAVVQDPLITQDSVTAAVISTLGNSGIPSTAVTVVFDTASPPGGHWRETGTLQTVSVSVQYRFGFFGPMIKAATGSEVLPISVSVTMRNE